MTKSRLTLISLLLAGLLALAALSSLSALAAKAASAPRLSPAQLTFSTDLSADTGLNLTVIEAWTFTEGGAANNFLNLGGPVAARLYPAAFSTPAVSAQTMTSFLQGKKVLGNLQACPSIRAILSSAKSAPSAQLRAIGTSGWGTPLSALQATYTALGGR